MYIDDALRQCSRGFQGFACQHQCPYPWFGFGCKYKCECNIQFCNHISGCSGADICLDGYYGKYCDNQCPYPSYGYACQQRCLCSRSQCHFSTGCNFKGKDLSNQNVEQTASTMSASTNGHFEILKHMSIGLQEHTQHSTPNRQFTTSQPIDVERPKNASIVEMSPSLNKTSRQDSG
uniref:Multiple epidermal growth factor-like domains protein 10 n=1 Tax=Crassostrea virginica TaxID=6565 RepID=A0A8B8AFW8_CRAVI|nr:multiple epidermal growth factor-like domains protein 10 [Crassostrea virginica]